MAVGPIHSVGPTSRFRPRFTRLVADSTEYTSPTSVGSVAAVGEPGVTSSGSSLPAVDRGPVFAPRAVSRFNPRIGRPATAETPSTTATVNASSVASRADVGTPQVISVGGVQEAVTHAGRPVSRFRPRIERKLIYAPLVGAIVLPTAVGSTASVGTPTVSESFSLNGGGTLPDGVAAFPTPVDSTAAVGTPTASDTGAVVLALSVDRLPFVSAPRAYDTPVVWPESVASVAAVGQPDVVMPEFTVRLLPVGSTAEVGTPEVSTDASRYPGPAGRKRRYLVDVDGETFEVGSVEEAQELLARAVEVAEEIAPRVIKKAQRKARKTASEVLIEVPAVTVETDDPDVKALVESIQAQIEAAYARAARDLEIQALMKQQQQRDEDEEALIALLL